MEESQRQLEILKKNDKARIVKIKNLKAEVVKFQEIKDNPPAMENMSDIRADYDACALSRRELKKEWDNHQDKQRSCVEKGAGYKAEIASAHQEYVPFATRFVI